MSTTKRFSSTYNLQDNNANNYFVIDTTGTVYSSTIVPTTTATNILMAGNLYVSAVYVDGNPVLTTGSFITSVVGGVDITVSTSGGSATVNDNSTLQSVTSRGSITTSSISIQNATSSTSVATGALVVYGGVGVAGTIYAYDMWSGGSEVITTATVSEFVLTSTTTNNVAGGTAGEIVYQVGTNQTNFIPLGTSSTILVSNGVQPVFTASSTVQVGYATNVAGGTVIAVESVIDGPVYAQTMYVGTTTQAAVITTATIASYLGQSSSTYAIVGGTTGSIVYQTAPSVTGFITTSSLQVGYAVNVYGGGTLSASSGRLTSTTAATSTTTGALIITGGLGVGGSIYATNMYSGGSQVLTTSSTISSTVTSTYATNIIGGAVGSIPYQYGTSITNFIPIGSAGYLLMSNGSTATFISPSTLTVGASNSVTGGSGNVLATDITATNFVSSNYQIINNIAYRFGEVVSISSSTTTSTNVSVDFYQISAYRTSKYLAQIVDSGYSPNRVHIEELIMYHDNNSTSTTAYVMSLGYSSNTGYALGTWTSAYTTGTSSINLYFTPSYVPTNMVIKLSRLSLTT